MTQSKHKKFANTDIGMKVVVLRHNEYQSNMYGRLLYVMNDLVAVAVEKEFRNLVEPEDGFIMIEQQFLTMCCEKSITIGSDNE